MTKNNLTLPNGVSLLRYSSARTALAECHKIDEVKSIRDKAIAVQVYAALAKDMALIDNATDIRMRAEIRGGELLKEMAKRGERQKAGGSPRGVNSNGSLLLKDLGISKMQSSRWQKLASLPKDQQEDKISRAKKKQRAVLDGTAKRTRVEMRAEDDARVAALKPRPGKYRTLVVDPPWDYEWLSIAGRATPGYATMSHEQLLAMADQFKAWSEDNCHLYLWATNNFMTRACDLVAAYGFQHRTVLTWRKMTKNGKEWFGLGSYFRNSTEHVLFATKGELRTRRDNIRTIFDGVVGEHSEKPEEFYEIVRAASHGPFGEVFQRQSRPQFENLFVTEKA